MEMSTAGPAVWRSWWRARSGTPGPGFDSRLRAPALKWAQTGRCVRGQETGPAGGPHIGASRFRWSEYFGCGGAEAGDPFSKKMEMSSHQVIPVFRGLIIPLFNIVQKSFFFLQSVFLCFLIFLPLRGGKISLLSLPALASHKRRILAEKDDAKMKRVLAERVEMVFSLEGKWGKEENESLRCKSFVLFGTRRNALFCRCWMPADRNMKAILVIMHGLNEHSGRYAYFASQLTQCNFGVYAMDWIGHGGSDGLHGYVPSLDLVVADTEIFLEKIRLENPGVPCFLFGHSTGGAVVLKATLFSRMESLLEGIILTSPALRVKPSHAIIGAVAPILSFVLPKYQFRGANEANILVSRDPSAIQAKYSDPLVYTRPIRVRTGYEILRISSYLMRNLRSVTIPFLVLHGTADKVTDPLASQHLYNEAASKHKNIKLYEGFLHDLLFEPERDEIGSHIINWMENRLQQQRS